jgi:hypothetical protein
VRARSSRRINAYDEVGLAGVLEQRPVERDAGLGDRREAAPLARRAHAVEDRLPGGEVELVEDELERVGPSVRRIGTIRLRISPGASGATTAPRFGRLVTKSWRESRWTASGRARGRRRSGLRSRPRSAWSRLPASRRENFFAKRLRHARSLGRHDAAISQETGRLVTSRRRRPIPIRPRPNC